MSSRLAKPSLAVLLLALDVGACSEPEVEVSRGGAGTGAANGLGGTSDAGRGGMPTTGDGGSNAPSKGGANGQGNGGSNSELNTGGTSAKGSGGTSSELNTGGAAGEPAGGNPSGGNGGNPSGGNPSGGGSDHSSAGESGAGGKGSGGAINASEAGAGGDPDAVTCSFDCGGRNGSCKVLNGHARCVCVVGFRGDRCELDVNECEPENPCSGACTNTFGSFFCECPSGYAGLRCEHRAFQSMGVLPGDTSSRVAAISRDGKHLVGTSWNGTQRRAVAFEVPSGTLKDVSPEGASDCDGSAISGDGSVVIGRCKKTFRFSGGSAAYFENELADALVTEVSADASILVGVWPAAGEMTGRAFRATSDAFSLLPCPDESRGSQSNSVSADGSVIALRCNASDVAFSWSIELGTEPLPRSFWPWDPYSSYVPTHVSSDGSTIVGYIDIHFDLWTAMNGEAGFWRDGQGFLTVSGVPTGCSADGRVQVGNSESARLISLIPWTTGPTRKWAYVDDGSGSNVLQAIENSPDAVGWNLGTIVGVSDDGKVIAGTGTHDGHPEAWVAHLP